MAYKAALREFGRYDQCVKVGNTRIYLSGLEFRPVTDEQASWMKKEPARYFLLEEKGDTAQVESPTDTAKGPRQTLPGVIPELKKIAKPKAAPKRTAAINTRKRKAPAKGMRVR